jgi:hypothetical protein
MGLGLLAAGGGRSGLGAGDIARHLLAGRRIGSQRWPGGRGRWSPGGSWPRPAHSPPGWRSRSARRPRVSAIGLIPGDPARWWSRVQDTGSPRPRQFRHSRGHGSVRDARCRCIAAGGARTDQPADGRRGDEVRYRDSAAHRPVRGSGTDVHPLGRQHRRPGAGPTPPARWLMAADHRPARGPAAIAQPARRRPIQPGVRPSAL